MPSVVTLPRRSNAITFDAETVSEVNDLLAETKTGEGVAILDDPVDTEQKARVRGRKMADALKEDFGVEVRVGVQVLSEPDKNGNGGEYMPVVRLKR